MLLRRQFGIFRVNRTDMVVFRHRAAAAIAQLQQDVVVHRHLDGLTHALVGIGLLAVDLGQLVRPDHQRRHRHRLGFLQAQPVEHVDELAHRLVHHVDFLGFERRQPGRRIGAEVDILDAVEIGAAIDLGAPPGMAFLAGQRRLHANLERRQRIGAGADSRHRVGRFIAGMDDRRRIIRELRDQRDVGRGQHQLHGMAARHLDGAVERLVGVGVDQRRNPAGHRVALDILLAPAGDVAGHVLGGEIVAIVPLHALADVQRVFGGVVVDLPAFQQHAAERPVVVVFDQVFQVAAGLVGDLRPVGGAGVLQLAHAHLYTQGAALLGHAVACCLDRPRQTAHGIGGSGGDTEHRRPGQEFAAAKLARLELLGIHQCRLVNRFTVDGGMRHGVLPVTLFVSTRGRARILRAVLISPCSLATFPHVCPCAVNGGFRHFSLKKRHFRCHKATLPRTYRRSGVFGNLVNFSRFPLGHGRAPRRAAAAARKPVGVRPV